MYFASVVLGIIGCILIHKSDALLSEEGYIDISIGDAILSLVMMILPFVNIICFVFGVFAIVYTKIVVLSGFDKNTKIIRFEGKKFYVLKKNDR